MKFAQFKLPSDEIQRLGVLVDGKLFDVTVLADAARDNTGEVADWLLSINGLSEIIKRGDDGLNEVRTLLAFAEIDEASSFSLDQVDFLPPVFPGKILAIGRNYADHALEGGEPPPPAPLIFNKLSNSLTAHNTPVVLPPISSQVDFEAELAVVIGRRAKKVSEAEALNYVFGYAPLNDVSARDLQFGDGQWVRGKGLDGFAPLGPFITMRDEMTDPNALNIEGRLNGEVMQSSNTSNMIFKVPYLISYISQGITLEPGDVIATGTPEGVGFFRKPPVLLKDGDVFTVTIEKLGTLQNTFVSEKE